MQKGGGEDCQRRFVFASPLAPPPIHPINTIKKEEEKEEEKEKEEEEEAEGRDKHRVPGIRDKVRSRHVGASGPKSRQALLLGG